MDTKDIERLMTFTPLITLGDIVPLKRLDPSNNEETELNIEVRPGTVMEFIALFGRFPMLKQAIIPNKALGLTRAEAFANAGDDAMAGLIAQNLGKFKDAKVEAWIKTWTEHERFDFFSKWAVCTMPEGPKDFLCRVVRLMGQMKILTPQSTVQILKLIDETQSNLVTSLHSALSTIESPTTLTEGDSEKTSSSSTSTAALNSNSEDVATPGT